MPYSDQVNAEPARRHVQALVDNGMSVVQIQNASGVNRTCIAVLLGTAPGRKPSRQLRAETAGRLLRVKLDRGSTIDGLVPAAGTMRRLHALSAIGWPSRELARRLGLSGTANGPQVGRGDLVHAATAEKVAELYRELSDTPGPSNRARTTALGKGWLPPLWWDEDTIDDPQHTPEGVRMYRQAGRVLVDDATLPRADRVALMRAAGYEWEQIAQRLGTNEKYVRRDARERPGFGCPGCRRRFETRAAMVTHARGRHGLQITANPGSAPRSDYLDDIAVARIMAGTLAVPEGPHARYGGELAEAIRRLAARGLDDTHVGDRVGRSKEAVTQIRAHNGIPAGVPRPEPGSGWTSRTTRSTSSAARSTASEDVAAQLPEDAVPA